MLDHSGWPPRRALQLFFEARTRQGIFRAPVACWRSAFLLLMLMKQPLASCKIFHLIFDIIIDIILTYVHIYIYIHGLVSKSIHWNHWNIEFLGRLVLIFKFASELTRLWNLHASNEPGRPDVILLGASISACEKGRQWQHALSLLKDVIWLRKRKGFFGTSGKVFHRVIPKDILILEMSYTEMRPIFVIGCLAYRKLMRDYAT